jgi:glycine/D-amino acid oxidase-like deaminating enzyme
VHVAEPAAPSASRVPEPTLPPLSRADVCIAGASLPALLAAYLLVRAGRSVVMLEPSALGAAQPGIGAARMTSLPDEPWARLRARGGREGARRAARSHAAAIDALGAIVQRERIACELERLDAYCIVDGGLAGAMRERDAALDAGVEEAEAIESLAVPGGMWGPCVRHAGQVRLQPLKLVHGLARAIARGGGRIVLGATPARVALLADGPALLTAAGQSVRAQAVVATHEPHAHGRLETLEPARIAHVVGVHVPRGSLAQALYRDARACPVDASLLSHGRGAGEVLLVGGEDPPGDEDHTAFRYLGLERWARERFPGAGDVVQRGTVQALPTGDLFAFGSTAGAAGVRTRATGGSALTRAMLSALAIADFIEGADTPWAALHVEERAGARRTHAA